jgi:hypothetical protein
VKTPGGGLGSRGNDNAMPREAWGLVCGAGRGWRGAGRSVQEVGSSSGGVAVPRYIVTHTHNML